MNAKNDLERSAQESDARWHKHDDTCNCLEMLLEDNERAMNNELNIHLGPINHSLSRVEDMMVGLDKIEDGDLIDDLMVARIALEQYHADTEERTRNHYQRRTDSIMDVHQAMVSKVLNG